MADQRGEAGKRTVLDELRTVPWPAAVALFLGGAASMAILLVLVIGSGSGSAATRNGHRPHRLRTAGEASAARARPKAREAESPPAERPSIARMAGQRFMVGLRGVEPSQALLADARRGAIGGAVLFPEGASPAAVKTAVAKLQQAAEAGDNPRLLIATDQEGGPVKRFQDAPPHKPLSSLSSYAALREGQMTGIFLRRYGINVDLAPVVDLGLPESFMTKERRTISSNPDEVTKIASAFDDGLEANAMPVAKHFPGLGGASTNTDEGRTVVEAGLASSLKPYKALIYGNVPAIMLSTAIYATLDPSHGAAWSRRIVGGLLRREMGFRGLAISDDLSSAGVADSLPSVGAAAIDSAKAGVDIVMIADPESFPSAYEALLSAAEKGRISEQNLTSSYDRILLAKERFAR
jgi:beta-N-acetylhexosaminidase